MPILLRLAVAVTLLSILALVAQPLPIEGLEMSTTGRIVTALVALIGLVVSIWLLRRKGR